MDIHVLSEKMKNKELNLLLSGPISVSRQHCFFVSVIQQNFFTVFSVILLFLYPTGNCVVNIHIAFLFEHSCSSYLASNLLKCSPIQF